MSKLLNLELTNTLSQNVIVDGLANLGNITRKYCCTSSNGVSTFTFANGSSSVSINQCGYYQVKVNATFTSGSTGTATIQLKSNGVSIPQAQASETITTADTEIRSLSFGTIVRVLPNAPITLTIANTGIATDISILNIEMVKII